MPFPETDYERCWRMQTRGVMLYPVTLDGLYDAAPALLEACRLLLYEGRSDRRYPCYCLDKDDSFHRGRDTCDNCVAAAAIAKAEGRGK